MKATLKQAQKYLAIVKNQGKYSSRLGRVRKEWTKLLKNTLNRRVFRTHKTTYKIKDINELIGRIQSKNRRADGEEYSPEYLDRKMKEGGPFKPHTYQDFGLWRNVEIKQRVGEVTIGLRRTPLKHRGFDYIKLHESKRSVIKATILLTWEKIKKELLESHKKLILSQ